MGDRVGYRSVVQPDGVTDDLGLDIREPKLSTPDFRLGCSTCVHPRPYWRGSARGTPPVWGNESSAQYPCVKRHRSCSNERRAEGLTTPVNDGDGERPPMARVRLSPPPRRRPGHRARRPASRSLVVPAGGVPRSQIGEGRSAPIRGDGTTRVGKKGMLLLYRPGIVPALEAPCS